MRQSGDDMILLAYSYTVEGQRRIGTRFDFAGWNKATRFEELGKEFPLGGTVAVYYDPRNPSRAVLRPGVGVWTVLPLIVSGLFVRFGYASALALAGWALN